MLVSRAVLVLVLLFASRLASGATSGEEGHATMDDGVRIYYRMVGAGEPTVVVPVGFYLEGALAPLAEHFRVVFYDPRHRGRSDRGDLAKVSLDTQVADLEALRRHLGLDTMAVIGWSGPGMEMAVYAIRHPERVSRLAIIGAVPPSAAIMRENPDARNDRIDHEAREALFAAAQAGEIDAQSHCQGEQKLMLPSNFVDRSLVTEVPDICQYDNEWPEHLWPYFGALLGSFGDYDWRDAMQEYAAPVLVIHGAEDGIPLAGARAWARSAANARLMIVSAAGHFPFLEKRDVVLPALITFFGGDWPEEATMPEG